MSFNDRTSINPHELFTNIEPPPPEAQRNAIKAIVGTDELDNREKATLLAMLDLTHTAREMRGTS